MSYPFGAVLLDTSVVIKWFVPEEGSRRAVEVQQACIRGELRLCVPDILLMELADALRYSERLTGERVIRDLQTLPDLGIEVIPFEIEVPKSSVILSLDRDLAVYDAYFVALAQALGIPLITADRKMLTRLRNEDGAIDLKDI